VLRHTTGSAELTRRCLVNTHQNVAPGLGLSSAIYDCLLGIGVRELV